ncbi:hypothetical protein Tco_1153441 [Tanacetum coccineum]
MKTKSTLMMCIPNEHQLKFNLIKDAKSVLEAVEKRFGGNAATNKTQRNLLKQYQASSPYLANEDLQQLHLDDLEEMYLRWQMAMLTMRARRFSKNTKRKLTVNGNETIGFDKSKEHGKLKKKCASRDNYFQCFDFICGLGGYDWSDHAEEGPTNYALMAYSSSSSDSEVSYDTTCSKSDLNSESVEEKLIVYKKNESIYEHDIKELKLKIHLKEIAITELRKKLEKAQQEKDGIQLNVDKLEFTSESLDKLIKCQIVDNCKKGLGYNAVPPPYTGNFMPPTPDFEAKTSKAKPKAVRKNNGALIIKDWVSDSEEEYVPQSIIEKKAVKSRFANIKFVKPKQQEKTTRKTNIVPREVLMKSGLVSINTARQNISKTTIKVNTARQVNDAHSKTTVNAARPMSYYSNTAYSTVKRPIHKNTTFRNSNINQRVNTISGKNVNTAKPKAVVNAIKGNNVNVVKASACWVWKPKTKVIDHVSKHSSASITLKKLDYVDAQGRSKSVMAWVRKKLIFLPNVQGNPQIDLQDKGVIDSGCSRHMTGNVSYITNYEEIDRGYVAFGVNLKEEKS